MREFLNRLNLHLKGFRTMLSIVALPLFVYIENVITTSTTFSLQDLKVAAVFLAPALLKAMWTEVRPKVVKLWTDWIGGKHE